MTRPFLDFLCGIVLGAWISSELNSYARRRKFRHDSLCCRPGCNQPHENWPDAATDGQLCQDHWEEQCDQEWWKLIMAMSEVGWLNEED
jgi:hypothetical protein